MTTFSALTEPWIPVVDSSGAIRELGIIDTLAQAHRLQGICDPAPPIEFGIYRLLVAFVMDAYGLDGLERLEELLASGSFDSAVLDGYVNTVGRERFDLFDPEHPFLQSPLGQGASERPGAPVRVFQHLPSGGFLTHFHHMSEDGYGVCPADCLRGLVTVAPFMTAGGAGYSPSVNGAPPWYVLVRGRNLFETISLNCYALEPSASGEPPAWRSSMPVTPKAERTCSSFLEALTWRPRLVRLTPGQGGMCSYCGESSDVLIREIVFTFGFRSVGGWTDPQVAYRIDNEGPTPLRPREERELWRDTGPFMLLTHKDYETPDGKLRYAKPGVVEQLSELRRDGLVGTNMPLVIDAYGMRTDMKMKIFEWQHEALAMPAAIAESPRAGRQVQLALELAESVSRTLGTALKRAYPRQGTGNDRALGGIIAATRQTFWGTLRPRFEQEFLTLLARQDLDDSTAESRLRSIWEAVLRQSAVQAFEGAIEQLDSDAAALRRQVEARNYLMSRLRFAGAADEEKSGGRRKRSGVGQA